MEAVEQDVQETSNVDSAGYSEGGDGFFIRKGGEQRVAQEEYVDTDYADNPADDRQVEAYRKLQSERDKLRHEYEQLKTQYSGLENVKPIADLVYRDPEILDIIEKRIKGEPLTRGEQRQLDNAQTSSKVQLPERPAKPQLPEDYDPEDAISNPKSESAKYEKAMRKYYDDMLSFQDAQLNAFTQERAEAERRAEQERLRRAQIANFRQEAVNEFGASSSEADAFIQWASTFDDSKPDNRRLLFNAWKMTKNGGPNQLSKAEARVQQMRAESRRLNTPSTVTGASNAGGKTQAQPESFIVNKGRRRSLI